MTIEYIEQEIQKSVALLLYFSAPSCNVCKALKPKLFEAIESNFERFTILSVDISETPEIAAHFNVFAIPTALIFLDGREFLRKSRNMSVDMLIKEIERPYKIMLS